MKTSRLAAVAALLAGCLGAPLAQAQFAVIDVASVTQLIEQVQTLEQQLATARSQLSQAQAEFQAMTGTRGMQSLLSGTNRNYLPSDGSALLALPGGSFAALDASVRAAQASVAVLTDTQLKALGPAAAAQLGAERRDPAVLSGLAQQALSNASARFAALQQLINAIGQASDQKAALDLAARISAEAGMLQNENTKLQVLFQTQQAQSELDRQHARELAIAGHGRFDARFSPAP
ncbi:MAG: hypothetical protein JSS29_14000 [Proteobacteria bacterium]|nr:hypothetical protein [Pseudomonadota bacterium]